MKIKILLVPSLIILTIVLITWFIYPAYTNGIDGIKENHAKLKVEKEKLAQLEKKIQNVNALSSEIERKSPERDALFNYVPELVKEEEIIDNLNFLASASSLAVFNLSVSAPKAVVVEAPITSADTGIANFVAGGSGETAPLPEPKPKPREMEVKFSVAGNYGAIKELLAKVYRFKRYNDIITADIKKAINSEGQESGDLLQANMVLSFEFYPKVKEISNVENAVFSQSSFNMQAINKIQELTNVDVLKMQIDSSGKGNPFLP